MLIIPAIDIKNGRGVRLVQGDPNRETVYSDDPVSLARGFEGKGAKLLHVVDLDGAFEGSPVNRDIVVEIAKSISIPIEIGGGIRNIEMVEDYLDNGIERIIIGTALVTGAGEAIIEKYSEYIIVGVDARDSIVATHGWKNVSDISAVDLIKRLQNIGIGEVIYTDISKDGMLGGPNFNSIETILSEVSDLSLIASGGVVSIDDIYKLSEFVNRGLKGCIVGKAIYDGKIDLENAISLFE
ncbi:MAG: 1-(5-phosphoribosyl)-5-[(5-phosphoribosylamino)methylideneamino]imidazole-4-carboxamide isomerase [Spirochaetota bacterium]|nr:1-(5-phosphoribosyl)-5-[(5-phosphoribosylamino)methylideneamino]imidazole-4-carboxamide isomerase [Spirochaetota bacterium]